ncbi:MAG TPA: ATP-binding protein [Methylomirabilota bacterium]|nr:ATP-binding protein [Methylomirabilota bacterium]
MKLDKRVFTSRVARRAFLLFVACALLPVTAIAALGFWQVNSELHAQSQRRLQQASKSVGMVLFQRLQAAEASLGAPAGEWNLAEAGHQRPFVGVLLVTSDGQRRVVSGDPTNPPAHGAAQRAMLGAGKTVLSTESDAAGKLHFFLSRAVDRAHPERGILHGTMNPAYLWAIQDEATLPSGARLIILDASGRLIFSSFDTASALPAMVKRQVGQRTAGFFEWNDGHEDYLAAYWSLFLRYAFGMSKWTVVLNQAKADVVSPIADFKRTFVLGVLLTVWLVLLVSISQIRKNLTPLDRLHDGTRRLARGDLDARVDVRSGDEFEELASSFNGMAAQLGRQFDALAMRREISATLNPQKPLDDILQTCADLLARHLNLALVGVWIVGPDGSAPALRACAGTARRSEAPLEFPLRPERLEAFVRDRRPHASNTLSQDASLCDPGWAQDAGLVAFVAHPLMVDDRLVGVATAFASRLLDGLDLSSFGAAAGDIAGCVDRKRVSEALQDSEVRLRQLQKMEAVGRLAGGIAHDFNNLLTVIMGRSALLLRAVPAEDPKRKSIENIDETAQRAALLTRQLLAFSRKQVLQPGIIDLKAVVVGMSEILKRLIGPAIEFSITAPEDLGSVKMDRGQTEQILVNLVVNARDAMPDGGQLTVHALDVVLDELEATRLGGLTPGPYVMLGVTDTGIGMDAHTQARIFEPFFTTKEPGRGTGLGLATVFGIVRQGGGAVAVESAPGAGTTFRIYLPRVDGAAEATEETSAPIGRGTETVLLVEDESGVRALMESVLTDHGYTVLAASRPGEAIRIAERHTGPIHLLLSDMVMPEMPGTALARELVAMRPDMALLFVSGYADYAGDDGLPADGHGRAAAFLQKPFTPDLVARTVRSVLDDAGSPVGTAS